MNRLCIGAVAMAALSGSTAQAADIKLTANNIDAVIKEMTLEEKARLLVGYTFGTSYWGLPTSPDPTSDEPVLGAAGFTAKIERFGIPNTVLSDGPAGVNIAPERPGDDRRYYATALPIGSLISSTWDVETARSLGSLVGQECEDFGIDVLLGPGLNLMRNPLCGRNFEYYSEDPILSGRIAAAYIDGVQSHDVGTAPKHFAANSQESNRRANDAILSQRALRELYLKGFEIVVREAKPWTIMSSYNKINGTYAHENHDLLQKVLRQDWGYDGMVMTDWNRPRNTSAQVIAGNDLLTPGTGEQITQIIEGVRSGAIPEADLDRNVRRLLQYIVRTPRFKGRAVPGVTDLEGHAATVRRHAPEGMVLLANDSCTLPVRQPGKVALFGSCSYRFYPGGSGSGDVYSLLKVNLDEGLRDAGFEIDTVVADVYDKYNGFAVAEAEAQMGRFASNDFYPRPRVPEPPMGRHTFRHAADRNDMAIITLARKSGEGEDRKFEDYALYPDEVELLRGVYEAFNARSKKVIVIINTGGPIETEPIKKYSDAILLAWQPGVEAGHSVADVLTGAAYPSGKLPMTWAVKIDDVPSSPNFPVDFDWREEMEWSRDKIQATPNLGTTRYDEGLNVGYRYFATEGREVSYPFGYGLGYAKFEYSEPVIRRKGDGFIASVRVTNVSDLPGREVVQLYVTAPEGQLVKPAIELKAFGKTRELKPGESETLTMRFSECDLASFDEAQSAFVTDAGTYNGHFAASSQDIRHTVTFKAKGAKYPVSQALAMP